MTGLALTLRRGGLATLAGYVLVFVVFFRVPGRGLAAAGTPAGLLFVVVVPVAGLLSGAYAVAGGPFGGLGLFLSGTYLGLVGLTFGLGLVPAPGLLAAAGVVLFLLSVASVSAGLLAMWPTAGVRR